MILCCVLKTCIHFRQENPLPLTIVIKERLSANRILKQNLVYIRLVDIRLETWTHVSVYTQGVIKWGCHQYSHQGAGRLEWSTSDPVLEESAALTRVG